MESSSFRSHGCAPLFVFLISIPTTTWLLFVDWRWGIALLALDVYFAYLCWRPDGKEN